MVAEWYIIACGGGAVALRIEQDELGLRKRSEGGSSRECQDSNPIWDVGLAYRNMLRFLCRTNTKAIATTVDS